MIRLVFTASIRKRYALPAEMVVSLVLREYRLKNEWFDAMEPKDFQFYIDEYSKTHLMSEVDYGSRKSHRVAQLFYMAQKMVSIK